MKLNKTDKIMLSIFGGIPLIFLICCFIGLINDFNIFLLETGPVVCGLTLGIYFGIRYKNEKPIKTEELVIKGTWENMEIKE